ncbi:MAG TPA: response regulator transcription factor [Microlunatus sp.]
MADDSTLFRQGLIGLLQAAGMAIPVEARDGSELTARLLTTPVDVAIVDLRMPPTFTDEGLRLALRLRRDHPSTGILVLSTYADVSSAVSLLADGGRGVGYLLKDRVDTVSALIDTVERLHRMETVIDPSLVVRLVSHNRVRSVIDTLSVRERQVLELMAQGRSNNGIAAEMYISTKTVERHIADIFIHLGLPPDTSANRRVLAVLTWLQTNHQRS